MTAEQIEVGDKLLNHMLQNGGTSTLDQYPNILKSQGYDYYKQIGPTVETLKSFSLIFSVNDFSIGLTPEGYEAAKAGLSAYFNKRDYAAELDIKSKETAIKTARWSLAIAIAAFLYSVFPVVRFQPLIGADVPESADKDRKQGNYDTKDIKPNQLIVPENVAEFKKTLTHDSVFIKELAKEVKRLQ